jgi:Uma2 family endonuclease
MAADPPCHFMSVEEYLELDRTSPDTKYEYIDGYVYEMRSPQALAGRSIAHARIAFNTAKILDSLLSSGSCRVYTSDVRVQVSQSKYVYPDITVSCEPDDWQEKQDTIYAPRLIIEVLSPSTEAYDRGRKFAHYQQCVTLQEYVLVNTQRQAVETYRREHNAWLYRLFEPNHSVEFTSINISLDLSSLYEHVTVPINDEPTDI